MESELPDQSGVSTPLLLMPFGIVPSSDVSLLLSSVTGRPVVKRAMPAIDQPEASHLRCSTLRVGISSLKLVTRLWRRSNAESARLSEGFTGLTGSGRPDDWSMDFE